MEGMGKMLRNCDGLFSFFQLKPLLSQSLPAWMESVFAYQDNQQSQSHSITDTNHKLIEEGLVGEVLLEHADVLEDGLDDGVDVPLTVVGQLHRHQHQAEPDQEKILLRGNKQ